MNKHLLVYFLFSMMAFAQNKSILKVIEPVLNSKMQVRSYGCQYADNDTYFINNNYVVYENCTSRKILYLDMKTVRFPKTTKEIFSC